MVTPQSYAATVLLAVFAAAAATAAVATAAPAATAAAAVATAAVGRAEGPACKTCPGSKPPAVEHSSAAAYMLAAGLMASVWNTFEYWTADAVCAGLEGHGGVCRGWRGPLGVGRAGTEMLQLVCRGWHCFAVACTCLCV